MRSLLKLILLVLLVGCSDYIQTDVYNESTEQVAGIFNTIERARFLSNVVWMPMKQLEANNGIVYDSGSYVQGVPYSSVKEVQTYIGHDVSVYTFLTASMNPYSLLYTEKIDQLPYNGTNCRLYYGVVCSSAVMYALGLPIPYSTTSFLNTELFTKSEKQSPEDISLCSILLQPGHMTMVVGIDRGRRGNIVSVDIFEAKQSGTSIYTLTFDQFCNFWKSNELVQYEYKFIEDNTEMVNFESDIEILGNYVLEKQMELCPSKGDKSSYTNKEDVIVNILTADEYEVAELYRDGLLISTNAVESVAGAQTVFQDLLPGEYTVRLANDQIHSDWAYFEVVDVSTDISIIGDEVKIHFNSTNATSDFVSYNSIANGAIRRSFNVPIGVKEFTIPYVTDYIGKASIRVTYRGKYGRVFYQSEI